jgi:FtsZ-interacting cell division protein YlmF
MGFMDRLKSSFRGDEVPEDIYNEQEVQQEPDYEALDGTYARPAYQTPQKDKVVAFPRARSGESYSAGGGSTQEFRAPREARTASEGTGGFSLGGGGSKQTGDSADAYVVFKRLKDFPTATQVADRMVEGKIVILNLESCDDEMARRVLDFIGGVAYACSSLVKRIAGRVFMITPKGVNADGEFFDEIHGSAPGIKYDD